MGGDCSPSFLFKAIEQAAREFPQVDLVVFTSQAALDTIRLQFPGFFSSQKSRIEFQIVADVIEMHEEPLAAIRKKKDSSLVLGLKFLKIRYLDGFVSTGNTGAFIAGAALFFTPFIRDRTSRFVSNLTF